MINIFIIIRDYYETNFRTTCCFIIKSRGDITTLYTLLLHAILECLLQMYINPSSTSPDFRVTLLDSPPRMSRMDRNSRSVSQPRGKRDSSVSSAYGGGIFFVNIKLNRHLEIKAVSRISLSSHTRARLELGLFLLTISKLYYSCKYE